MPALREGQILVGPSFNEPVRVETIRQDGDGTRTVGVVGTHTERFRRVILIQTDLDALQILSPTATHRGDAELPRLGLQAYSLGIAYEFDPYSSLSISRVDPLPHQLEALYDYLLKLARGTIVGSRGRWLVLAAAQPKPPRHISTLPSPAGILPGAGWRGGGAHRVEQIRPVYVRSVGATDAR